MDKAMNDAVGCVESAKNGRDQVRRSMLVELKNRVRNVVGGLQQSRFGRTGEVWNIAHVCQHSPLRAEPLKIVDPNLRALLVLAFCENQQAALLIAVILVTNLQKEIESVANDLQYLTDGSFTVPLVVLFDHGRKCDHVPFFNLRYGRSDVGQNSLAFFLIDATPKTTTRLDGVRVEFYRRRAWKMLGLDGVHLLCEEVNTTLRQCDASQDEVLVGRIARIPRFVEVEYVQDQPRLLLWGEREGDRLAMYCQRASKKEALSVAAPSYYASGCRQQEISFARNCAQLGRHLWRKAVLVPGRPKVASVAAKRAKRRGVQMRSPSAGSDAAKQPPLPVPFRESLSGPLQSRRGPVEGVDRA